jgi:predicted PurR-regulated permease PerM
MLRLLIFSGSLIAVLVILIVFDSIFMPLILGLAIAYLFDPVVSWFEARGRSRVTGVVVLCLVLLLAVGGLVGYLIPAINNQLDRLRENWPRYAEQLKKHTKPLLGKIEDRFPEEIEQLQANAEAWVKENLPRLASSVGRALKNTFSSLLSFVLFLLNLIFVPVFAFYLLVDLPKIKRGATELIPLPYRALVLARLAEVNGAVSSFLRGQLTIALVLAAINATGLLILGVPLGLVIGLIAGLANMIPYMALIVGLGPALLLCWAEYQSVPRLVGVLLVFGGAQLLEGTVLSPRILSRSVNLHPVWVLLAIIAGGSLFGFFGMLLAVPVTAAIQVFVRHWLGLYRSSDIFTGGTEDKTPVPVEGS